MLTQLYIVNPKNIDANKTNKSGLFELETKHIL